MRSLRLLPGAVALLTVAVVVPGGRAEAQDRQTLRPATTVWTGVAGVQQVSLRDVARTGPPVDSSPVAREGDGPMFVLGYRHHRPDRVHRLEFAATLADDFSYVGGRGTAVLPPQDDATSLEGRYEYRRYPFRDAALRGFDVGVGVEAILDRTVLSRSFVPAIAVTDSVTRGGAGVVAAARLRRWSAIQFEASWTNAALLARAAQSHSIDPLARSVRTGPGWITDLDAIASIRVAGRWSVAVAYRQSGEGLLGTRPAWTIGRSRASVGAEYVR
jgi:hypothetical protein